MLGGSRIGIGGGGGGGGVTSDKRVRHCSHPKGGGGGRIWGLVDRAPAVFSGGLGALGAGGPPPHHHQILPAWSV